MNKQVQQFWQDFRQKHNLNLNTPVDAWAFGATTQQADELAELVNRGIKTATTSAYELYDKNEKHLKQVSGILFLIVNRNLFVLFKIRWWKLFLMI